ncbi:hypothetical protein P8452_54613 [Trifolium repens]|nr:hypothetical protein P8452_54613 [Trifolium repens]
MIWNAMRDENEDGFKGSSVRAIDHIKGLGLSKVDLIKYKQLLWFISLKGSRCCTTDSTKSYCRKWKCEPIVPVSFLIKQRSLTES